jgi:hypothetical protein
MLTTTNHYDVGEQKQKCVSLSRNFCNERAYQKCSYSHFKFTFIFIFIFMLVLRHTPPREGSEFQRHKIKPFSCIKFHFAVKTLIQALRIVVLRVIKHSTAVLCYCVSRTAIRPIIQSEPGTCKTMRKTTRQRTGKRRKEKVKCSKNNIRTVILTGE